MTTDDADRQIQEMIRTGTKVSDLDRIEMATMARIAPSLAARYQKRLNILGDRLQEIADLQDLTEVHLGRTVIRSQSLDLVQRMRMIQTIQMDHLEQTIRTI
jgi:hypothetical protein